MKKLLFFGDSITACGRDLDAPVYTKENVGEGFVRYIDTRLFVEHPYKFSVNNQGIGGHRVTDLEARIQKDVLDVNPDVVFMMIGINDVWRNFDGLADPDDQVDLDTYKTIYEKLIKQMVDGGIKVLLGTPYFLEKDLEDPMRQMMDQYREAAKEVANNLHVPIVDTQIAFDGLMNEYPSTTISDDRVHMNYKGNTFLGMTIYRSIINELLNI